MYNTFFLKGGGSPTPRKNITNQEKKKTSPTPGNIKQGLKTQNQKTQKKYTIWDWKKRGEFIPAKV